MVDRYTSFVALALDRPVADVGAVVAAAARGTVVDRHAPVGDAQEAQEVYWGGRMQKAIVRRVESEHARPMLRVETYIGGEGPRQGLRRQAQLVAALADVVTESIEDVLDLSAAATRDLAWLGRVAGGDVALDDVISAHAEGDVKRWVHTHGAARLDVPDLELYGVPATKVGGAADALQHVHAQLLSGGLKAALSLQQGTAVHLVPVLEAWQTLPLDWPGIARAGENRPGHGGPRATLSVLHKRRFGRYRRDYEGVLDRL
ncbi:MAG: hypothetical protein ACRDUY_05815 [Nitriliruptorales bacterium]